MDKDLTAALGLSKPSFSSQICRVRQLIRILEKAGFIYRGGKGSHKVLLTPQSHATITISGQLGDDPKHYQEKEVRDAIRRAKDR